MPTAPRPSSRWNVDAPRWRRLTALLAAVAAGLSAGALPAAAQDTHWSVAPATADGPDGRVSLRHVVEPGGTVSDAIAVTNLGTAATRFAVTAGDGVVGASGAFDIAVPADAVPGDHPAGITVGVSADEGATTVQRRIGIRVHLRVAGDVTPALDVRDVSTTYTPSWIPFAPGTLKIDYALANTGNVRLGATAALDTAGPFGLVPGHVDGYVEEMLPGTRADHSTTLSVSPVFALFGDLSVTGTVVGEDQLTPPAPVVHAFTAAMIPWAEIALVLLLVGVAAWFVVRKRRKTPAAA